MEQEWIVVHTAQGEIEETQVRSFLRAHGIPTATRGEALRKTHGLTLDGLGQVEVLVAPEDAVDARALLAAANQGDLRISEVDGGEGDPD
jgi:predicted deacylase